MAWGTNNPSGQPTNTSGDFLEADVAFTGLPTSNSSFGRKNVTITVDGAVRDQKAMEVFFPRDAANHPGGISTDPNWFNYWGQLTDAVHLAYGGANLNRFGYFDYNGSDGHLDKAIIYDTVVLQNNPTGPQGQAGLDCFGQTATHELKHRDQFYQSGYPDTNGDGIPDYTTSQDQDLDWLSDIYEDTHGFDKTKQDTNGNGILDLEEEPIAAESNWPNDSKINQDWANPGKNHK